MKPILIAVLAGGLIFSTGEVRAETYDVTCSATIAGEGTASNVEGSNDWNHFHGKVPPGLARRRAIDKWQAEVSSSCPRYVAKWWRARGQHIECDAGAGHQVCTATATPVRKLFSWLHPE